MTTKQENKFCNLSKSIKLQKMIICFMLYAIFGWLYEVFLEVVIYRWGFSNRGVLFGPYCPIYGVGATIFLYIFQPFFDFVLGKMKDKQITVISIAVLVVLMLDFVCTMVI